MRSDRFAKIDTFIQAAEGSKNYHAFAQDMKHWKDAFDWCGLPHIKADAWFEFMKKMSHLEIQQYVEEKYVPGLLNPFDPRT